MKILLVLVMFFAIALANNLLSGGLGLTEKQWELKHTQTAPYDGFATRSGKYLVAFRNQKIWYIEAN